MTVSVERVRVSRSPLGLPRLSSRLRVDTDAATGRRGGGLRSGVLDGVSDCGLPARRLRPRRASGGPRTSAKLWPLRGGSVGSVYPGTLQPSRCPRVADRLRTSLRVVTPWELRLSFVCGRSSWTTLSSPRPSNRSVSCRPVLDPPGSLVE